MLPWETAVCGLLVVLLQNTFVTIGKYEPKVRLCEIFHLHHNGGKT